MSEQEEDLTTAAPYRWAGTGAAEQLGDVRYPSIPLRPAAPPPGLNRRDRRAWKRQSKDDRRQALLAARRTWRNRPPSQVNNLAWVVLAVAVLLAVIVFIPRHGSPDRGAAAPAATSTSTGRAPGPVATATAPPTTTTPPAPAPTATAPAAGVFDDGDGQLALRFLGGYLAFDPEAGDDPVHAWVNSWLGDATGGVRQAAERDADDLWRSTYQDAVRVEQVTVVDATRTGNTWVVTATRHRNPLDGATAGTTETVHVTLTVTGHLVSAVTVGNPPPVATGGE